MYVSMVSSSLIFHKHAVQKNKLVLIVFPDFGTLLVERGTWSEASPFIQKELACNEASPKSPTWHIGKSFSQLFWEVGEFFVGQKLLLRLHILLYTPTFCGINTKHDGLELVFPFEYDVILGIYVKFQGECFP